MNSEIDLFGWISVEFEMQRVQRDLSIGVCDSMRSEAEDILGRLEGGRDFEFSEERAFLL
jgi:hypothetical protein